jgi:hypothetical protein
VSLAIFELSFVPEVFPDVFENSNPRPNSILPLSGIRPAFRIIVHAIAMRQVVLPLTLIAFLRGIALQNSEPVLLLAAELSTVYIALIFAIVAEEIRPNYTNPHILLTFELVPVFENNYTISMSSF